MPSRFVEEPYRPVHLQFLNVAKIRNIYQTSKKMQRDLAIINSFSSTLHPMFYVQKSHCKDTY